MSIVARVIEGNRIERCEMSKNEIDKNDNNTPDIHISSLGFLRPPVRYTLRICRISDNTIREEDHLCKLLIMPPKWTLLIIYSTEENAERVLGL